MTAMRSKRRAARTVHGPDGRGEAQTVTAPRPIQLTLKQTIRTAFFPFSGFDGARIQIVSTAWQSAAVLRHRPEADGAVVDAETGE